MTSLPIQQSVTQTGAQTYIDTAPGTVERIEAFFSAEAAKDKVALRLMLLGTAVTTFFAVLGYLIFGEGDQHQFFRDIGPVTGFAAAMTFAVGFIGLMIADREHPDGGVRRLLNFWFLAGAGFILLTFDAPMDLHGRLGHIIQSRTTVAEDIGFHATSDAILAVYMLAGLTVAAVYWRELLRYPVVIAHLMLGGLFIAGTIGIDGFATHTSWMWILEEQVELLGLAWIVGAFAIRLNATTRQASAVTVNAGAAPAAA